MRDTTHRAVGLLRGNSGRDRGRGIRLWDANTGNLLKILIGHTDWIASVSFSPDGKTIVSGSWDKTVRLWDVETGNLLKTLETKNFRPIFTFLRRS